MTTTKTTTKKAKEPAVTTTTTTADTTDIRARLVQAQGELAAAVLERTEVVRSLVSALLTRSHVLLLGPPGTAKSYLTTLLTQLVSDADRFSLQLTRTTDPSELFGMWDVGAIDKGVYRRLDNGGTIRSAHVAYLDECFKASSSTLNALLETLNERTFRNGTEGVQKLPLITCVGCSNEYPQGDDLAPLYDRFLQRHWIGYLAEQQSWLGLMLSGSRPKPATSITLAELQLAQAEVEAVQIDASIGDVLWAVKSGLEQVGIKRSDRRWVQSLSIAKAQAWLDGRQGVDKGDLLALKNVLWDNAEEEGRKVEEILLSLCAPKLKALLAVMDLVSEQMRIMRELETKRMDLPPREYQQSMSDTKAEFSRRQQEAEALIPDAGPAGKAEAERLAKLAGEAAKLHAKASW